MILWQNVTIIEKRDSLLQWKVAMMQILFSGEKKPWLFEKNLTSFRRKRDDEESADKGWGGWRRVWEWSLESSSAWAPRMEIIDPHLLIKAVCSSQQPLPVEDGRPAAPLFQAILRDVEMDHKRILALLSILPTNDGGSHVCSQYTWKRSHKSLTGTKF